MVYDESLIRNNLEVIKNKIQKSLLLSGITEEPKIIAITKTHGLTIFEIIKKIGIQDVGENYIQELCQKMEKVSNLQWHFVGGLQRNKVKYIMGKVKLIHSVDSLKLAEEMDKRAKSLNCTQDFLIQINQGEASKGGVNPKELENMVKEMNKFTHISLKGLMALPPYFEDPEKSRPYFQEVRYLLEQINKKGLYREQLKELSMGMSNDYFIAVEEGATYLRIGTALFGERKKIY